MSNEGWLFGTVVWLSVLAGILIAAHREKRRIDKHLREKGKPTH